jgi:hypothetical protein
MERRYELEIKRRSIAMLPPGHTAPLTKEAALALVGELVEIHERMRRLRELLRAALQEVDLM